MQMGPAPLTLVNKAVEACYDTKFVASEVNADFKVYVLGQIQEESDAYNGLGSFEMTEGSNLYLNRRWVNEPFGSSGGSRKKGVGAKILTKKPGSVPLNCRKPGRCDDPLQAMDITNLYKEPDALIGVDPPNYVPLVCPRLDEDDEESMEDENAPQVTDVVLPVVEKPIEYPTSPSISTSSFAQEINVKGRDLTTAGYIVEAQRLTDLGVIYGGDVQMDTVFLIRDISRVWTQQDMTSRDPFLAVTPGQVTVVTVRMESRNMHQVRSVVLSITAKPVDYRGKPVVYKELRNRKIHAKVQFSQSGATRIRQSGKLNPSSGVQTFSYTLPDWVFSWQKLQSIGVDIDNCVAFDFIVSAKVTETGQMLVSEQRVHWALPS